MINRLTCMNTLAAGRCGRRLNPSALLMEWTGRVIELHEPLADGCHGEWCRTCKVVTEYRVAACHCGRAA